eukprot:c18360_g1_i1 orf=442-2748(+)
MCLLDNVLSRCAMRLIFCELIKSRKARFFVVLAILLMLLGLASREPTELYPEVREASVKLTSTTVYLPDAFAWINESTEPKLAKLPEFFIQDVVLLPDNILLLIRMPENDGDTAPHLPPKEKLTCLFNNTSTTSVSGIDYSRGRALVRCHIPDNSIMGSNIAGKVSGSAENLNLSQLSESRNGNVHLLSGSKVVAGLRDRTGLVKRWSSLVFELWVTQNDVVLFAKGINRKQGHNVSPDKLNCVFGDTVRQVIETKVTVSAQEVFRCAHPGLEHRQSLAGKAVTLKWRGKVLPTIAYYEETSTKHPPEYIGAPAPTAICACTMIYNVAKFLLEWGTFHSHVGVDRFILYDNNSEDELDAALTWLSDRHVKVSRYPWPWPKTQEAGFSHCTLAARHSCEWVLFTDVDEFVFPAAYSPPSGRSTPLRELIAAAEQRPRQPVKLQSHLQQNGSLHSKVVPRQPQVPQMQLAAMPHQEWTREVPTSMSNQHTVLQNMALPEQQLRQEAGPLPSMPRQHEKLLHQHEVLQQAPCVHQSSRWHTALSEQHINYTLVQHKHKEPQAKPGGPNTSPSIQQHKHTALASDASVPRGAPCQAEDHVAQELNVAPVQLLGQISLKCRDFGPSNLIQHPTQGVTQGYVCRSKKEQRHKSLVKLAAVSNNLQNVVHHFNLLPEYTTITENPYRAVVNHYKFQAWPEFRQKFRRRVSAYVVDWKEDRNLDSRDRTPGLGSREEKPPHWETGFCDITDTALRDYCRKFFGINISGIPTLAWQL